MTGRSVEVKRMTTESTPVRIMHFHRFGTKREDAYLVNPDRFTPQLYLVHDFTSVLRVFLSQKLTEPIALVSHRDPVFGQMNVHCDIGMRIRQVKTLTR
jgi:hypothetical protein